MPTLARFDTKKIHKTPRGEAIWPKVVEPGTKFDKAGVYEIRVKFSPEDEKRFLAQMEMLRQKAYQSMLESEDADELDENSPPWKKGRDGRMEFKFKLKASGFANGAAWKNDPPQLFDATGK